MGHSRREPIDQSRFFYKNKGPINLAMKIIAKNKKATFDYEILESIQAGMILTGPEVKSIRAGHVSLKGSYISIASERLYLRKVHVTEYKFDQGGTHNPFRDRELLVSKKEIHKLSQRLNEQGIALIPLSIGLSGKYIKCEFGVARGKKKYDKRQSIKERETNRHLSRIMRQR
ncbi:SsrA-binding protein SmpB [Candidatus Peregrinibacteria bacterium]|nr:MAG: SsrA-binding protein SmpB [Candidatus Peregrinibacteria bacterium]